MYDYYKAVCDDVRDWIQTEYTTDELAELTFDQIFDAAESADLTGNMSGQYDYPEVVAPYVMDNLALALGCAYELGYTMDRLMRMDNESLILLLDILIRENFLGQAIDNALEEREIIVNED